MSSLSSGVYSTSSSSNTTSTSAATSLSNGGGVSNQEGTVVGSVTADTGVSGTGASTGVSGGVLTAGDSSNQGESYGYSSLTLDIGNYATHYSVLPSLYGNPSIGWNASGVDPMFQKVRIFISKMSPVIEDTWDIRDIPRSKNSVRFGDSNAGTVVKVAKPLTRGSYYITIWVYDNDTNFNNSFGGGNFVVQ